MHACVMCACCLCLHTPTVDMSVVYNVLGSTTRLPSHCAQVKEMRKSLYDSESGVKKMAMGHHLGERSHLIE